MIIKKTIIIIIIILIIIIIIIIIENYEFCLKPYKMQILYAIRPVTLKIGYNMLQ